MKTQNITFEEALGTNRTKAMALLTDANLPTNDIDNQVNLFVLLENKEIIGTGGLEQKSNYGLLRSISVVNSEKGKGYGQLITEAVEQFALKNSITDLFLLTTTAKDFFEKKCGYQIVDRKEVPIEIQNSQQFSSVCPSSAIVMHKKLTIS
ncbi:GCN5-related N-acetyltransferase [Emticicia oligotrophica DSM 17448]|uniref:GCN5-related N-acetyltransferase n=1 Tax=Emticicia oligotrophica (strain DSM 17448 / CIP 109782 / MTCC 6937 / GPTSA100-15) TaxID=929562 RepID=A0ABM5MXF1_EMTOG|nr:arsenic resistance N-acetyltransferase ArsN2 [Emticicia oligotrophica]AFK01809.1 GCN5-related N-acetyltransferase [Emticicia oligotrophica DSM 17448]